MRAPPIPYAARPGAGFVLLVATAVGAVAFVAWGAATPPLDRVARLEREVALGRGPLTAGERRVIEEAFCRHPEIAADWVDGAPRGLVSAHRDGWIEADHAYVVDRRPEQASAIVVEVAGRREVEVAIEAREAKLSSVARPGAPLRFTPPPSAGCPRLIEVRLRDPKRSPRVRVTLEEAP